MGKIITYCGVDAYSVKNEGFQKVLKTLDEKCSSYEIELRKGKRTSEECVEAINERNEFIKNYIKKHLVDLRTW